LGLRPFQEVVEELKHRNSGGVGFASREHELVVLIVGGVAVGPKIVSATVDSNEPSISVLTRASDHAALQKTFQLNGSMNYPSELKSSRWPSDGWRYLGALFMTAFCTNEFLTVDR
jgi:hypothetical protein